MIKRIIFFTFVILFLLVAMDRSNAQVSSLGEAEGESAILLNEGQSGVTVTSKDPSLDLSFQSQSQGVHNLWGFDLSGKTKGDIASLMSGKTPYLSGSVSFGYSYRYLFTDTPTATTGSSSWDFLYFGVGASPQKIELFNQSQNLLTDSTWLGYTARVGYNYVTKDLWDGSILFGAALIYGPRDNTDTLSTADVQNIKQYPGSGSNTSRQTVSTTTAYIGTYQVSTQTDLNLDILWVPKFLQRQVGISIFTRSRFGDATDAGLGFYFLQAGAPSVVKGGVVFEITDFFNSNKSSASTLSRGSMSLVLGYPL